MFPRMNDSELHCEDLERVERCYKLLLDAGSYIGSINYYGYASAFHVALSVGTLVRRLYRDSVDAMQLIISRQN